MTPSLAPLYSAGRDRVVALAGADSSGVTVPACPLWTVRDLVTHLVGVASDVTSGRMEGAATPAWTEAQLAARAGNSIADSVAEWRSLQGAVDEVMEGGSRLGFIMVADVTTHELDLRGALGDRGGRDSDAVGLLAGGFAQGLGSRLTDAELPALRLAAGEGEWVAGEGEPAATLTTPSYFELLRALTGRRTAQEIRGYDWEGDPTPWIATLSIFPFPEASLDEA